MSEPAAVVGAANSALASNSSSSDAPISHVDAVKILSDETMFRACALLLQEYDVPAMENGSHATAKDPSIPDSEESVNTSISDSRTDNGSPARQRSRQSLELEQLYWTCHGAAQAIAQYNRTLDQQAAVESQPQMHRPSITGSNSNASVAAAKAKSLHPNRPRINSMSHGGNNHAVGSIPSIPLLGNSGNGSSKQMTTSHESSGAVPAAATTQPSSGPNSHGSKLGLMRTSNKFASHHHSASGTAARSTNTAPMVFKGSIGLHGPAATSAGRFSGLHHHSKSDSSIDSAASVATSASTASSKGFKKPRLLPAPSNEPGGTGAPVTTSRNAKMLSPVSAGSPSVLAGAASASHLPSAPLLVGRRGSVKGPPPAPPAEVSGRRGSVKGPPPAPPAEVSETGELPPSVLSFLAKLNQDPKANADNVEADATAVSPKPTKKKGGSSAKASKHVEPSNKEEDEEEEGDQDDAMDETYHDEHKAEKASSEKCSKKTKRSAEDSADQAHLDSLTLREIGARENPESPAKQKGSGESVPEESSRPLRKLPARASRRS
jgi:hypothetical protein